MMQKVGQIVKVAQNFLRGTADICTIIDVTCLRGCQIVTKLPKSID